MRSGVIFSLILLSCSALAGGEDEHDQMAAKQKQLQLANNTTNQLQDEIAELERVSAERARKIKALDIQLKNARQALAQQQALTEQARARAQAAQKMETDLSAELAKTQEQLTLYQRENAKEDEAEKAELQKIERERQAEQKKKAELSAQIAKLTGRKKKFVAQKRVANEQVDELYRYNSRLYDKIKNRRPAISIVSETKAE